MAEPKELASMIGEIVRLSTAVIDTTIQNYSGVLSAHRAMIGLLRGVSDLKNIFSTLQRQFAISPDVINTPRNTPLPTLEDLNTLEGQKRAFGSDLTTACYNTLRQVHSKLESGISRGRRQPRPRSPSWPLTEREIQKEVSCIYGYCGAFGAFLNVDVSLLAETCQVSPARKEQAAWYHGEECEKMFEWLSPLDFTRKHGDILSRRHDSTGDWLLTNEVFCDWLLPSPVTTKTLLCSGHPGVGKSFLSSRVIDHLKDPLDHSRTALAYIYCDYGDRVAHTASALVGSICRQLIAYTITVPAALWTAFRKSRNSRSPPNLEELVKLLTSVIGLFSDVYIIIDAIDELDDGSSDTKSLLLQSLACLNQGSKHIFITSRPHSSGVEDAFTNTLRLDIKTDSDDARSYLIERVSSCEDLEHICHSDPAVLKQIVTAIMSKSNNQFLLSALHVDRICDCTSMEGIEEALKDMAVILDDTYAQSLERIEEQAKPRRNLALNILMTLSCSKRPLLIRELQEIVAIQPGKMELSKSSLRPEKTLTEVCAGLVRIDAVSRTVRLVHHTLQEYLEKNQGPALGTTAKRNAIMAQKSLAYLQFTAFSNGACGDRQALEDRLNSNYFYHYASRFWADHMRGLRDPNIFESAFNFVNESDEYLSASIQAYSLQLTLASGPETQVSLSMNCVQDYPRNVSGLWVASNFGLILLAERLLQEGAIVDAKTSYGETALHVAARKGDMAILQLLQKHRAQISMPRGFKRKNFEPAIYCVPQHGPERPASLKGGKSRDEAKLKISLAQAAKDHDERKIISLLKSGVDAHSLDKKGRTALHWAVFNGLEEIVVTLLDHGAKVNTIDGSDKAGRTPLHEATRKARGSTKIMQILLEHGANPNLQCSQYAGSYSPLHEATLLGDCAKVALLLEFGANKKILDQKGQEAVDIAISMKNDQLVQILSSAQRGHWETPLHLAATKGHLDVVDLLLSLGAEREALTSIGETPLHWAASTGQLACAQLLISKGCNVSAKTASGETPLHISAFRGNTAVAGLLVDNGSDINSLSNSGQSPLYTASFSGAEATVRLLLSKGASVDARGNYGATPLIGAAIRGHTPVVRILLEHGADIDASHGYDGKTALHRAAQGGYLDTVNLLLREGANIEARDGEGSTPLRLTAAAPDLQMTSTDGTGEMLECLLKQGADIEAVDLFGETPLHRAAFNGYMPNVRLLLRYGAKAMAEDPTRWHGGNGGWSFLQRVVTSQNEATGRNVMMDLRGWPAVVQAALAGHYSIVNLLLESGIEQISQQGVSAERLLSLAEYRHKVHRRRALQGGIPVVDGGWTPIEVKGDIGLPLR